jgi:hypothetical protein
MAALMTTGSVSGCLPNADPKFTAADPNNWNSQASFNFKPQSGSPAVNAGVSTLPSFDLFGIMFTASPNLGSIQGFTGNPISSVIFGGNVRK